MFLRMLLKAKTSEYTSKKSNRDKKILGNFFPVFWN